LRYSAISYFTLELPAADKPMAFLGDDAEEKVQQMA
jgi:hypothetical protein